MPGVDLGQPAPMPDPEGHRGDDGGGRPQVREDQGRVRAIQGAEVRGAKYAPQDIPRTLRTCSRRSRAACPNLEWSDITAWYGGEEGGHIGFCPVARLTGPKALRSAACCAHGQGRGAGLHGRAIPINARSFINVTLVVFDTKNETYSRSAYDVRTGLLVVEAAKQGYGEYRAHLNFMDLAAEQYSFQRPRLHALLLRRSRTCSTPTGSSGPASRGSGPGECGRRGASRLPSNT